MSKRLNVMKVNSYKKGTCLITLQNYVIVNMFNELEKKKWYEAKTIMRIPNYWEYSILECTPYYAGILMLGFRSYSNKQFMRAGKINF